MTIGYGTDVADDVVSATTRSVRGAAAAASLAAGEGFGVVEGFEGVFGAAGGVFAAIEESGSFAAFVGAAFGVASGSLPGSARPRRAKASARRMSWSAFEYCSTSFGSARSAAR